MRPSVILSLSLASAVAAQTPTNLFEIYSGCTNYTDRGTIGVNAGEMLMQVNKDYFLGVGQDVTGSSAGIMGFRYTTQDERPVTTETYYMVIRGQATSGGPAYPGAPIVRGGPLTTPPSTSPTPVAWIVTSTFATAVTVPLCDTYYMGGELAAAPAWNNPPGQDDGQSFHISTYYLLGGTQADNPAPNALNLTWNVNFANNLVGQPGYSACTRIGTLVTSPVLNMGNIDPTTTVTCLLAQGGESYGAAGLFPQTMGQGGRRNDGLNARIRDAANPNGLYAVFLGAPAGCPGLTLSGIATGALYLNPSIFANVGTGLLDATGNGSITLLPAGTPGPVNRFSRFQAFTLPQALTLPGSMTNFAVTRFLP